MPNSLHFLFRLLKLFVNENVNKCRKSKAWNLKVCLVYSEFLYSLNLVDINYKINRIDIILELFFFVIFKKIVITLY